jgi:SSS family transporter
MSVQLAVFLAYFAVLFLIGRLRLRRTRSEADYWIAGGRLGWLLGGATIAATHASAGTFIATAGVIHQVGWSFCWLVFSIPLAYWFVAAALAPRFTRQRELTLPAFIERRYYSRRARALAAAIILIANVIYIQAQIVAAGIVADVVLGVPATWGMIVFSAVLIAYTMVGGMVAVVYTDLLQLAVMVLGAAAAVPIALGRVGGLAELLERVAVARPDVFAWDTLPPLQLVTMGLAFALGSAATPQQLVRLYAMRDVRTIRRGVLLAIVVATGLNLLVFLLALASIVLFPELPSADQAIPMLIRHALPPLLGSILLAAITAAMMSTVDSLLIVAGAALSKDIYESLLARGHPERTRRLWLHRTGILVVGTTPVALVLAGVGEGELVQFIVLLFSALMGACFFVPVVAGVYWRRATREGAIAAMLGGLVATLGWKAWGPRSPDPVLAGFLVSALLLVVVSRASPPPPPGALAPYFPAHGTPPNGRSGQVPRDHAG